MRIRLLLLLALALFSGIAAAGDGSDAWPFGRGSDPMERGRDLFNLGLIGAKASDADNASFGERETKGGMTRVTMKADADPTDAGPKRLKVEILFPKGPAERAGLRAGDVIVGVGEIDGGAGLLTPMRDALVAAESGESKGGAVVLRVLKGGSEKPSIVEVKIPVMGKDAKTPFEGKCRQRILDGALAWLAEKQQGDGGYPETLSSRTGVVVQSSLAGLAWMGGGSDLQKGRYAKNLQKAFGLVSEWKGKDFDLGAAGGAPGMPKASWDQTSWGYTHGAIFLGELGLRHASPKIREPLFAYADTIAKRQEASGGWAHGPGGKNALGYIELNIMTSLAICAMGEAKLNGWKPPAEVVAKAAAYLKESAGEEGGVGYSTAPGQKGEGNIGRSAGAWIGFCNLGLKGNEWFPLLQKYVETHAGETQKGHASLMQHILLAGVAAQALGGEARERYWKAEERDLVLARAPDGSLQPRPWHESLAMGSNSDVSFGEVWTTAAWAIVLGCEKSGERPGLAGLQPKTGTATK